MKLRNNFKMLSAMTALAIASGLQNVNVSGSKIAHESRMRHLRSGITSNAFNKKIKNRVRSRIAKASKRRNRA